ncbi:MAG: transcriptional regulator VisN [Pararhizobium sp.]
MSAQDALFDELDRLPDRHDLAARMKAIAAYAGAERYLLMRDESAAAGPLEQVLTADWPFDLVRSLAVRLLREQAKKTEIERCLAALRPTMITCPDDITLPEGLSRQCCLVSFHAVDVRLLAMFLFRDRAVVAPDRVQEAALMAAYHVGDSIARDGRPERPLDLTERELECLAWISEGKTSDEISTIIGISRNTVNNYITSIMRKTATRTRSEAIALAVRNSLI